MYLGSDAIAAVTDLTGSGIEDEVFLFVDPPYIREGNRLYANGFTWADHVELAAALNASPAPWVLTYDDEPSVPDTLYPARRVFEFDIPHTANRQRIDREYLVISDAVALPAHPNPLQGSVCREVQNDSRRTVPA